MKSWDERYSGGDFLFGEEPNAFLVSQKAILAGRKSCLAVADGEGRNGVWLASQGLEVLAVDASPVGLEKARMLAERHGESLTFECADLAAWDWPEGRFDVVAAIFIQFAGPEFREVLFEKMAAALAPGGVLVLQGYRPEQVELKTGGPPMPENMYTREMLTEAFVDLDILHLAAHDSVIREGAGHSGISALIDMVAQRRATGGIAAQG